MVLTLYSRFYNRLDELYANEPSQAALERPSEDVYDVNASQQGSCVDSGRCAAFDRMNIQTFRPAGYTTGCTTSCTIGCKVYTDLKCVQQITDPKASSVPNTYHLAKFRIVEKIKKEIIEQQISILFTCIRH